MNSQTNKEGITHRRKRKKVSRFDKYFGKYGHWLSLLLIAIIGGYVYWDFLTFEYLFLYKDIGSDTLNIFYPDMMHIADYLREEGIPSWSFSQGMGQNIFPLVVRDPLRWLLYVVGSEHLAYGIVYVEFLKILISGVFFHFYLRTVGFTKYTSIVGSLLYAFSGFMILGGTWFTFSNQAMLVALLLYAFERLLKQNRWKLFTLTIALIAASMPFNLYLFGFPLLIYVLFRFFSLYGFEWKKLTILLCKMAGFGLLGLLIAGVFLSSNLIHLMEAPRVAGDVSYTDMLSSHSFFGFENKLHNVTAILSFFSNDLFGTGSAYKGWYNYLEAPMYYMGLLTLLLAPQIFHFIRKPRQRWVYILFLLFWITPIVFPYFRYAFWLFTGDYYRGFSLFVGVALLFYSLQTLDRIIRGKKLNLLLLFLWTGILLSVLFYPYFNNANEIINTTLRNVVAVYLILYTSLLTVLHFNKISTLYIQLLLLMVIGSELMYFSSITINKRTAVSTQELQKRQGYNDYSSEAIKYIKSIDNDFYRINKTFGSSPAIHQSINDSKVYNFYGTTSYSSFNQLNYIKFLQEAKIIKKGNESQTRWATGLSTRPLLQTWGSTKYIISKGDNAKLVQQGYTEINHFDNITIYENNFFLPFGFTYDKYLTKSQFGTLPPQKMDMALLQSVVVADEEVSNYSSLSPLDISSLPSEYSFELYRNNVDNLKKSSLEVTKFSQNNIIGNIELEKDKMLFFSIPFDTGWKAKVDGKPLELHLANIGFMGLYLPKGQHKVELSFTPRYRLLSLGSSILGLIIFTFLFLKGPTFLQINHQRKKVNVQ